MPILFWDNKFLGCDFYFGDYGILILINQIIMKKIAKNIVCLQSTKWMYFELKKIYFV